MINMGKCRASNDPRAAIITIEEALRDGIAVGYCVVCNEAVVTHKASEKGKEPQAAHFEHKTGTRPPKGPRLLTS